MDIWRADAAFVGFHPVISRILAPRALYRPGWFRRINAQIDRFAVWHMSRVIYCRVLWAAVAVHALAVAVYVYDGSMPPPVRLLDWLW